MSLIIDNIKTCNNLKDSTYGFGMYQLTMDLLKSQGKENSPEYLDAKQKRDIQKSKYDNLGCVVNTEAMDCIALNEQINALINTIAEQTKLALYDSRLNSSVESMKKTLAQYKLDYETKGCSLILNKLEQSETNKTISEFTALDEARINEETSYKTKQRIFFGGLVLVAGLVILTMFNKKK